MMKICFVVLSLAIAQSAYGLTASGKCPKVKLMTDFDLERYAGVWYEQERYPTSSEKGIKCITAVYSLLDDSTFKAANYGVDSTTNQPISSHGYAKVLGPGQLAVFNSYSTGKDLRANYNVLDTDYISYAFVYNCNQTRLSQPEHAWLLTRDQTASQEVIAKGRQVMVNNDLSLAPLVVTNQKDCPK